jgi:hypothetical protein
MVSELETNNKSLLRKHKFGLLAVLLCSALLISTYAVVILWNSPASATVSTEVQWIQVFDSTGTNNITQITFNNVYPSSDIVVVLIIKNLSPDQIITISWSSTLGSVTTKITNSWKKNSYGWPDFSTEGNHITLGAGAQIQTQYHIVTASDCPLQSFSWALNIIPG